MKKKIGVLLSGCGIFDGAEIHEATLTLYFLALKDAETICTAPRIKQRHVIDHQSSQEMDESRDVLVESARISRGNMHDLASLTAGDIDGLILPGGFGAAKNLIDYAIRGRDCEINPEVQRLIDEMIKARKPLGAICIAPMVLAVALKDSDLHPRLTIGTDEGTAADIEYFGARHQNARVDQVVVDEDNRIVTTPAYMLGPGITDVAKGIEALVDQVLGWA